MTTDGHGRTPIARMAQQQRALALRQQDSTLIPQMLLPGDDDSHLDLTARMRFLEACGGPPPYVLERVDHQGNVDRYMFERPFLLVGRSTACEVACCDKSVSFRHLYLQYFKGIVWWFDLDSREGVIQEGQKRRAGCLRPGMTISLGEYSFRLVEASKKLTNGEPPSKPTIGANTLIVGQQPDLPKVTLEFTNGKLVNEEKPRWPIENCITLMGRRSCCDIRFAHESVSRVHASLVLTSEGLWVVDLLGRGGTKVNGVPSAYAYLHDSSLIEFGGYKMRVRYGGENAPPHPAEAVLEEASERPRLSSGTSTGSVSEELIYQLVTNMAEMQRQMFDQSQMQITLLMQMMGSIHQSQQDLLRNELNRVHEITREMHELQLHLGVKNAQTAPPQTSAKSSAPRDLPEEFEEEAETAGDPNDSLPAPHLFSQEDSEPAPVIASDGLWRQEREDCSPEGVLPAGKAPPHSLPQAKSNEILDHAVLLQRVHRLDRERNSRLQKIFRAFRGAE